MEKTPESDRKETRKIQVNLRILKKFSHSDRVKHYVNDYILRKKWLKNASSSGNIRKTAAPPRSPTPCLPVM